MKNNFIYNILIFILILALLLIFINNLYIIEGSQNQDNSDSRTTISIDVENDYEGTYTVDSSIIDNNPGDASQATDSAMLAGAENTPELMDDGDLNDVYAAIDQVQNTLVSNLQIAHNSLSEVVLPETLNIRNQAYEFLSFRESDGTPIVASDLDSLRGANRNDAPFELQSDQQPPNNLNTDITVNQDGDFMTNMTAEQETIFFNGDTCLNVSRNDEENPLPTTVTEQTSFQFTPVEQEENLINADTIAGNFQGSIGMTCNTNPTENENENILSEMTDTAMNNTTELRANAGID